MSKILATPGPSPVPPQALSVLSAPVEHHRTDEFKKTFASVAAKLKEVFQTEKEVLLHCSSGTGAMESLMVNLHSKGDKVLCLNAGKFGSRWTSLATAYGLEPIELTSPWGESPSVEVIQQTLQKHPDIKSVLTQACETSTGQRHPIKEYAEALRGTGVLLLVDGISALGAYDLPMDTWGVDGLIGGAQKAFASLTGLSFIALSDRAWKAHERATLPRFYFDLSAEREAQAGHQTRFTSPVSLINSLDKSLDVVLEGGLTEYFQKIEKRALFCREFAQTLGLGLFPKNPSPSLTVLRLPQDVDGEKLQRHIQNTHNVVFMGGQDQLKGKVLRWGHMGHQEPKDQIQIAEALSKGLEDFGALSSAEWKPALQSCAKSYGLI